MLVRTANCKFLITWDVAMLNRKWQIVTQREKSRRQGMVLAWESMQEKSIPPGIQKYRKTLSSIFVKKYRRDKEKVRGREKDWIQSLRHIKYGKYSYKYIREQTYLIQIMSFPVEERRSIFRGQADVEKKPHYQKEDILVTRKDFHRYSV